MKVLFLTDEFYPDFGANSLVVSALCKELVARGDAPYVMPFNYKPDNKREEIWHGIHIIRSIVPENKLLIAHELRNGNTLNAGKIIYNAFASKYISNHNFRFKNRIGARKILADFIQSEGIDIVVSICCSVELSLPFLYLREHNRLQCRWIFYMIDPFAEHAYYRKYHSEKILKKWQHRLMAASDRTVTTNLIYEGISKWENKEILDKTLALNFPKIEKKEFIPCSDDITLPENCINVVCTGTRNEEERNSAFVLSVCKAVRSDKIKFHFVGHGWAEVEPITDGNITYYPPCSYQAAINAQLKADFLLNIGNQSANQLPSKVLEYVCTGNPIISSYKSHQCPVLPLLADYDSFLIDEAEMDCEFASIQLENFVNMKHAKKTYTEIQCQFNEFTPRYCVDHFFEV